MLVGILYGGQSGEHEISVISAQSVARSLMKSGHECTYVGINRSGQWLLMNQLVSPHDELPRGRVVVEPGSKQLFLIGKRGLEPLKVDLVFPILHGSFGEDGRVQGMLDCLGLPYVGAGTLGSAITNDKDITKRLLRAVGIPVAKYKVVRTPTDLNFFDALKSLGSPLWVKPANLGSSLGIRRVEDESSYEEAVTAACTMDHKVLVEEQLKGRELECSVLQDESGVLISKAGEIVVQGDHYFYDYDAKYNDPKGAQLIIPAKVETKVLERIQEIARLSFAALEGRHIMRIDMFSYPRR